MKARLAICLILSAAGPAAAEESGLAALGQIFSGSEEKTNAPPADFVVGSRPSTMDYVPLATAAPRSSPSPEARRAAAKARAEAQMKARADHSGAIERELDAAARANRLRAARVRTPDAPAGRDAEAKR